MTRGPVLLALALAALEGACASRNEAGRASPTAAFAPARQVAPDAPSRTDVTVEVRAPQRARYDASVLAATKPTLGIVVTNRSTVPLDVSDLRVYLEAVREGTSFRCGREVAAGPGEREPSVLAPGASWVFDRMLDCALPLVGAYAVRVSVAFGRGAFRVAREARAFTLTVAALPNVAPRELDGVPGLWASLGSSTTLIGSTGGGHGRILLGLVNASPGPIEPPPMQLVLRVFKVGTSIPCEDAPLSLGTPPVLGSGQTYYEPLEVSCLGLSVPGTYDVVAQLVIPGGAEGDREIPIGRLRVEVVTDPSLPNPMRWRSR